ncbi:endonuclease domain-containing protein [Pelagibius litoralis]|uniref:Endonuclease domain-containing protein n=1 Tax=Pelagibius litoralis TaxID=374515 RepID=A0A967KG57_9PROT|nr:endonuclease domain-containing protein [Pelagibius litoralis]NIA70081.1 endonuclease domain-containing protein [Pelagibius litoralis]
MTKTTFARRLRRDETAAERMLWARLRNRQLGGHKFRRQVPLGRFAVDFACYDEKLVVELDGGQHGESGKDDAARTNWLENKGFRVLRFWNNEVLENLEDVLAVILQTLEDKKPPHPDPLPPGEREK